MKNKIVKNAFISLFITLLLGIFNKPIFSDEGNLEQPVFEKGDFVYRELNVPLIWFFGHAGIYHKYGVGDPTDFGNQFTIESLGSITNLEPGPVLNSFHTFYTTDNFWGVRDSNLTGSDRQRLVNTAKVRIGCQYNFWDGYKNPTGTFEYVDDRHRWIDPSFRCDGLVEYCYEISSGHSWQPGSNGGLINNDVPYPDYQARYELEHPGVATTVIMPRRQMQQLATRTTSTPPTKITNPQSPTHNNAIGQFNDPQSRKKEVKIKWQDATDSESGLWGYYYKWDEEAETVPAYTDEVIRAEINNNTGVGRTEEELEKELGEGKKWYLHIRSIDQAGNWDREGQYDYCTVHIGPFYIDVTKPAITFNAKNGQTYMPGFMLNYNVTGNLEV